MGKHLNHSPGEEALGEGGDQHNLNEQADEGFDCCRLQVAGLEHRREETTPVEGGHTDDNRLVPGKHLLVHSTEVLWRFLLEYRGAVGREMPTKEWNRPRQRG